MSDSVRPHRRQPTRLPHPWDSPGKNTGVGCCFLLQCMKVKSESEVAQSLPTPSNSMDCSLPGSSIHGICQARVLGARVRYSAHGKGHEEGRSTYAKAGSSLRSPPGNPRASTPITRACLLYYFVLLPTSLTLRGAVTHHLFRRRS